MGTVAAPANRGASATPQSRNAVYSGPSLRVRQLLQGCEQRSRRTVVHPIPVAFTESQGLGR